MPNNNNRINFQVGYNVDQASVNAVKKSLQDLQNIKIGNFKGTQQQLVQVQKTAKKVQQALTKAFNPSLNTVNIDRFTQTLKQSGRTIDSVYNDFNKLGSSGRKAFSDVASQVITTNNHLTQTKTLLSSMGQTMMNTVKWGVASSVMNTFTNSVRQAFDYVKALDSSLNDIRIVTGQSSQEMARFADQANKSAQALGRSTMDYTKAALTFYQQGLDEASVQARTESVLKAQNITGAGEEMADYLTAVWNGYKVANEEAELYVDKLAAVADSSASNMSQLAIAMSKVASSANMLGVPVDSLNAQIATIVATTRNAPQTVGNALKTIYSRINDITTGAEDAQISLGNYSSKMLDVGISVLDANGNLRDTGDVIEEIGGKWENLSREQQIYLARTMAGQRQYNNLLALFDNWGKYTDLVNVSMESQGTTMQKNAIYMDSLAAKMEQLGAAGEKVKGALIDEESLKGVVQFGSSAVNLLGDLINGIGGSKGALLNFGSVFSQLFSNVIGKELGNVINRFQQTRNSIKAMAQVSLNTSKMMTTAAYSDQSNKAFREYVDNINEIHQTWTVLSKDQIQLQQGRAKDIQSLSQQKAELIQNQNQAAKLVKALTGGEAANIGNNFLGAQTKLRGLKADLKELKDSLDQIDAAENNIDYSSILQNVQNIYDKLGKEPNDNLIQFLNKLIKDGDLAQGEFDSLRNSIQQLYTSTSKSIDTALNIGGTKAKLQQLDDQIKTIQGDFQRLNQQAKNISDATRFVQVASAIGQIAGATTTVVNLFKTWKNQTIPVGQKIAQTLTSVGFLIPSLIGAYSRLKDALGVTDALARKKLLTSIQDLTTQKLITLEKEKQNLLDEASLIQDKASATKEDVDRFAEIGERLSEISKQSKAAQESGQAAMRGLSNSATTAGGAITSSLGGALSKVTAFLAGPGGIAVAAGIAAVAIGVGLYKAYNKAADAAKQAAQRTKQVKQTYDKANESYKNLKSSLDNLASATDHFKQLTTGTQEWRNALQDVNDQVLSLIQEFPQLGQYVKTTNQGLLYITEEGQNAVREEARRKSFASSYAYARANQESVKAQNYSLITDSSRKLDGLGGLTPEELQKVVTAVNQHGQYILNNSKWLEDNLHLEEEDIKIVQENTKQINNLAQQVNANTTASQNLTNSIIQGQLVNSDYYKNSSNPQAYAKIVTSQMRRMQEENKTKYGFVGSSNVDSSKIIEDFLQLFPNHEYANGLTYNKTGYLKYTDSEGKAVDVAIDEIISLINSYQLSQGSNAIEKAVYERMQKLSQAQSNMLSLFSKGVNGVKLDWTKLSLDDIDQILNSQELMDIIAEMLGEDINIQDVRSRVESSKDDIKNAITSYLEQLPQSVKGAVQAVIKDDTSVTKETAEALGSMLHNSYSKGLQEFQNTQEIIQGLSLQEILPFKEIVDSVSGTDITFDDFVSKLSQAGIVLDDVSNDAIQRFIDQIKAIEQAITPEQTYKTIHDIIDNLQDEGSISAEDAQKLRDLGLDLDPFFTYMADGSLKLETSAKEFYDYANNESLEGFKRNIQSLKEEIGTYSELNNSKYSYSNAEDKDETFSQFSKSAGKSEIITQSINDITGRKTLRREDVINTELFEQQLNFLKAIGAQDDIITIIQQKRRDNLEITVDDADALAKAVAAQRPAWEGVNGKLEQATDRAAILGEQYNNARQAVRDFSIAKVAPQEAYKAIHDVIDDLQTGDIISKQQAESLKDLGIDLDPFFTYMADGSLKLEGDAKEFYDYANNQSLDGFKEKIQSLKESVAASEEFSQSKYSYTNAGENADQVFQDFSSSAYEHNVSEGHYSSDLLQQQLTFLKAIGVQNDAIEEVQKRISEGRSISVPLLNKIAELVSYQYGAWKNTQEITEQNKQDIVVYQEQLDNAVYKTRQLVDTLDEDVNQDEWKNLSDYLYQYADTLEGVSDQVQHNRQASDDLAESMLRYQSAIDEVSKSYDSWMEALSSDNIIDQAMAGAELQNVYADLLDLPFENLSPDFTQNIDNLELLKQAVYGTEEQAQAAYDKLQHLAELDIITHVGLDPGDFFLNSGQLYDQYNNIQNSLDDIEIGAFIDNTEAIQSMNEIINAADMTAEEATDLLASMGVDAEVEKVQVPENQRQDLIDAEPDISYQYADVPMILRDGTQAVTKTPVPTIRYKPFSHPEEAQGKKTATALRVKSAKKSSGGGLKVKNRSVPSTGGKGGGGPKGSGSAPKAATQAKTSTAKIETKIKQSDHNPYEQQQKSFERQSKILDDLKDKQKKLVNKDRLKNLNSQNETLQEQIRILKEELKISEDSEKQNSTANYADRLKQQFGEVLNFDPDKQISDINALWNNNAQRYNDAAKAASDAFEKEKQEYNNYIQNTWNKFATQDQQNLHKVEKQYWDQRLKDAETAANDAIKTAEQDYKRREDLINSYNKALEEDQKRLEEIKKAQEEFLENQIAASKIKVDLSIDTGDFERDWLDFENKFIKKLDKDDFLGNAKASAKELMSYFNSNQVQQTANQIKKIRDEITTMSAGGTSSIYETNLAQAQEDLEEYMSQQMKDLQKVQDMVDDIKDSYLDAIDDAKDKMDDQIDQYERVNDLIDHNVKMVELLYGDKAYDSMQKYYNLQKTNNERELESLKKQQDYWQKKMDNEVVGSDAWKKFKENLDDVTDNLNDKLEDMIDNLAKQFENRVNGIIDRLNNAMTNGRGLDFLDEQWDYINNYDDQFLDTYNSKTGIEEIERLYKSQIDSLVGSPKSQQKLNKLMNDQLKLLREKDHLTEYDLERAKASLEVEKARLALEEARDRKTTMRLRRDSQGNYTYQYVADEEKLSDLEDSLAKAQNDLYNMDKQHYKQNLNEINDTWRNFLEEYVRLSQQANSTLDEQQRKRILSRRELLVNQMNKMMEGLTQDNKYNIQYLNESFFNGLNMDTSALTMEQQLQIMRQNIPQMQSNIQDLADTIVGEGGVLPATADMMKQINQATADYDKNVKSMLETAGTSLETIEQAVDKEGNALDKNITNAQNLITANDELIKSCQAQIEAMEKLLDYMDKYLNKVMNVQTLLSNLRSAYNTEQGLNGSNLTADNIGMETWGLDTTSGMEYTGNPKTDAAAIKQQIDALMAQYQKFLTSMSIATFDTGGYTGSWGDAEGRLAFLHQGELVLNQDDTRNILNAVQLVRNMANAINGFANGEINSLMGEATGLLNGINNTEQLDQNVHIEANFPNVTQHTQIEQAFENLVNMASMRASRYKD